MYEFPRLEVSSGPGRVRAQIIGRSALAKKLQSFLRNQEVVAVLSPDFARSPYLPDSPLPDFVYWFLTHNSRKLPQILGNYLKSSQAKLIIVSEELITNELNELIIQVLDAGIDSCRIFVNDVYGPAVGETKLSLIWRDLKSKFVINLPEDDFAEVYPIYVDDAASAIVKISFSTQTYGRTFYITGSDKTTVLSFSYRLREEVTRQTQKLPPINYTPTSLRGVPTSGRDDAAISSFSSLASTTRDFLNWHPDTDLSEGLKKLVSSCLSPSQVATQGLTFAAQRLDLKGAAKTIKKKTILHFRRAFVFPLALATLFFAATLSLPSLLDRLAASLVRTSPDRLARFEPIFTLFGRRRQFARLETAAALNLKQTEISAASGRLLQSIISESSISPAETLDSLGSQAASLLKVLPPGENRRLLGLGRELIPSVRRILTSPQKQTFLIVFQNSAQLRPTGGFISFLAFVTLQKGKILDIDYQSVDQLDSQLVGVETPPEPIKNYLGETNWLIRDANWSADVDQSAQKLTGLIARSTGRNLAGIIFLTTPALDRLLAQTGEITAPDATVWNRLNLVERLVYNDPGPQFASLAKALEEFIKTNSGRQKVIIAALAALDRQDLLISLPNFPNFPNLPNLPDSSDYLQVVDANLGANKTDYFMIKEHDIDVSLSDTQTSSAVTLRYRNPAVSSQYPAGTYRNYVRVYLPGDSIVISVVRLSAEGLVAVPTDNSLEAGRKAIGWYMEIPAAGQEIFRLEFVRPQKLILQNQTIAYSLVVHKQPGTAIPTSVSIGYPPSLAPLTVSDSVTVAGNKLLLNHSGQNNLSLNVEFATISENSDNSDNQNF